jgi:hypothetical protein
VENGLFPYNIAIMGINQQEIVTGIILNFPSVPFSPKKTSGKWNFPLQYS